MSVALERRIEPEGEYPDSDGEPMADNTLQFRWIVTLQGGLDALFKDNPNVFVAGDLLWYPVEGNNLIRTAPDVLVAFGRAKGYRGSYRQWVESNIAPQVVFEVLSPGNRPLEIINKLDFFERYGVEECYVFDPDHGELRGWLRSDGRLQPIGDMNGWTSPRLGTRFELLDRELQVYRPDGGRFLTFVELSQAQELATKQAEQAAALARQSEERAHEAEQNVARLSAQLRAAGIEPEMPDQGKKV